ncbi:MAG TPA: adenylate/guanylate cyclase domain-containing protein [Acidimicrobiia bacterium]|nr:adenylate/guanylate cyclase domain-containing protein [Acidimicrobiia bacterium]
MPDLPTGTVTFLFTDLEGSTRLWQEHPEAMKPALARHDEILRSAVAAHDGHVVKTTGDGAHAAFADARSALLAARAAQLALASETWGTTGPLRVRIGVHTGPAELRDGDYYGTAVNRAARLMSVAHGGQVVVSLTTEELVRDDLADGTSLRDLGDHQLRDLARAERVFQLCASGLQADFPPLQSLDAYAGNLPAQLTSFVGRQEELSAVGDVLRASRLVTLTGVGGVGKTRLALQTAAELLPELPDGAWFCELAAATDAETLVQIVAATLGAPPRAGTALDGSVLDFLRTRRALLILDNCEHLLDTAAELAERILQSCPGVRILATSREGLAVAGEQVRPLRSLSALDAEQLLAERARAVAPQFAVTAGNEAAVGEICRRLDGIPLAIELAAARLEAMSPVEIAQLLDERFRLLTGGRRTAVERHQTLRATVDWSYSLLDETDRTVYERLGVFAGSFDGSAAAAVVSGDGAEDWDVRETLGRLVRRSMLVAEPRDTGATRYSMLETLRQYARERLDDSGVGDRWRRRHAEHYANLAGEFGPGLRGADELSVRARVREELDNLRAAVNWALDCNERDDIECGIAIIAELGNAASADVASGIGVWAGRAVPAADGSTPGRRHAVLGAAAYTAMQSGGDPQRARALALDALRDGVPADSPNALLAHNALAMSEGYLTGWTTGIAVMLGAPADLAAVPDNGYYASAMLATTATMMVVNGDRAAARPLADLALTRARQIRNPTCLALALFTVGWIEWEENPAAALTAIEESTALTRAGAVDGALGTALGLAARIRARLGDATGACRALREAVEYSRDVGDTANLGFALFEMLDVLVASGHARFAARLAGALTDGVFRDLLTQVGGDESGRRQRTIERVRDEIEPAEFAADWARGAAMTHTEVIDVTLSELDELLAAGGAAQPA